MNIPILCYIFFTNFLFSFFLKIFHYEWIKLCKAQNVKNNCLFPLLILDVKQLRVNEYEKKIECANL